MFETSAVWSLIPSYYVTRKVLPPWLMGSALVSGESVLETTGIVSIGRSGSFWQLLTEAILVAPLLLKPCYGAQYIPPFASWNHILKNYH